ncbi:MAG: GAF domain-containing protein, partial [Erythrobacter sp.]
MTQSGRLEAIRNLGLEASADRALFSRITVLASTMLGCPTALLSIVEDERQWFLGRTGFECDETPRDTSFCAVCIAGAGPLLVSDARADLRFRNNPLVTGEPFIRSYLGVPIRGEGDVL